MYLESASSVAESVIAKACVYLVYAYLGSTAKLKVLCLMVVQDLHLCN